MGKGKPLCSLCAPRETIFASFCLPREIDEVTSGADFPGAQVISSIPSLFFSKTKQRTQIPGIAKRTHQL